MLLFQLEMVGGPCDGWRTAVAVTPSSVLRMRVQAGDIEALAPGEIPAGGRVAEYRLRDIAALLSDGPQVALQYDFRQYLANEASAAPYNCNTQGAANVPAAPSLWRWLLVSTRDWLLAPVDYPGCVRSLQ